MSGGGAVTGWQRLHPLSPVVRSGRAALPLIALAVASAPRGGSPTGTFYLEVGLAALALVLGLVHWLVTRWTFDGTTLRIETGLVRRDSQQLPVARIQAVDVVEPFLARVFGLAELRIRVAGGKSASRLAYLGEPVATDLRARLLATHHGLDQSVPEPDEQPMAVIPTGRLVGSVLLSGPTLGVVVFVVALIVLPTVSTKAAAGAAGSLALYLITIGTAIWRRFNEQYGFTVAVAPDGIRIRRGLLGKMAETIPVRRVQAVRQIEPLLWRMLGWCRLEVDLAGVPGHDRSGGTGRVTKALLPVGPLDMAAYLRQVVIGPIEPERSPPPRRARPKTPLSYHFLSAGHDESMAVAVTGRVQKVTSWVPLEKAQSVRRVQGPVQRALRLATVHVDVAGKHVGAELRDRDVDEADRLVRELATLSRGARRRVSVGAGNEPVARPAAQDASVTAPAPPPTMGAGWFADPAARHQARYWDGGQWTEHVADDGVTAIDRVWTDHG